MKRKTIKLKASDWVGLRALYLLLATDTSSAASAEVRRIIRYYEDAHGSARVYTAFAALAKDNSVRGTFDVPDVQWARNLDRSIA